MRATIAAAASALALQGGVPAIADEHVLEEIVVTADFREAPAIAIPASVSVLDREELEASAVQHFEEVTSHVPNLNWSGEGSRARYFQLRGIGELEQYEGAPNPSVGFIIDDIDFSALGSIASLFDVERVEILRGPQGTRYGANALGGLIYMRTTEPTEERTADFETTVGSDGTRAAGAAMGGPINSSLAYRFAVHRYQSNGFRDNAYLGRDDTYNRDELTTRAKLRWTPSDRLSVDVTALYADGDNGYDAWTIDNGFTTYSNQPGKDSQRSAAGSVRVTADLGGMSLVSISAAARSDVTFSFDADWGNEELWAPSVYEFFSATGRERRTYNQELRLLSDEGAIANGRGDWLVGVYVLGLEESNDHYDEGVLDDVVFCAPCLAGSEYDATNVALFGEIGVSLAPRLSLTAGLRAERRTADYQDTFGNRFDPSDDMLGGELALSWRMTPGWSSYARLARGYKGGGFNIDFASVDFTDSDLNVTAEQIEFDPEFLWSMELGAKGSWLDGSMSADFSVFYSRRDDQQIKIPLQLRLGDPSTFVFLTENADKSVHQGIEATVTWLPTERLALSGTLGLLDTEISQFALFPALEGRAQAHAPSYTFSWAAEYHAPSGWWGRVDVTGADEFFFDYSHDQKSSSRVLANLRLGRTWGSWEVSAWVRNLFDEEYAVRGFYFGNEPPDFPNTLYTRLGDPRHYGLTLRYRL